MRSKTALTVKNKLIDFLRKTGTDINRKYLLEINNAGQLRLCGIREIKSFDDDNILVSSDEVITEIKGENMYIAAFSETEISVFGKINTINFFRR